MSLNRLLEITTLLLNHKTITARELAERFEVSTRTIYRDVDALSAAGIPVYMSKGKGGGISLLEGYTLDRTMITPDESDGLILALKALQATQYPEIESVLEKVGALFHPSNTDWIEIDFSRWGSRPDENDAFNRIRNAILRQRRIRFDYVNASGNESRRDLEPHRLIFKSHAWYLHGYSPDGGDFRTFRITRIRNLTVLETPFERRPEPQQPEAAEVAKTRITGMVSLRFAREALFRVYDDFDDAFITKNPDGSCTVTFPLVEDEWIYGLVLSYGSMVEVLQPKHLRQNIAGRMRQAMLQYEAKE